jgi:branched-chain amino acid aminotransferase
MAGSQDYAPDPRNDAARVYVNGAMVPRAEARVSVFDAGFGLGDGVWEGIRLHRGRLLFLDAHIDRLLAGAAAIDLTTGLDRAGIESALRKTVEANAMQHGVHVRIMVTRGLKATVNQDPRIALGRPTVVITAEYKAASAPDKGLVLATSRIRCSPADVFDMRLNSHSRLNLILALQDAIRQGADEALMLDMQGHVSSCNATNFFWVRQGAVFTSSGATCFNGITRANIMALCRDHGIPLHEGDYGLDHTRAADEAFVTGTLGGVTPVCALDGNTMGVPGPVTTRLRALYAALMDADAAA